MVPFFHDAWKSNILDPPMPRLANADGEDWIGTFVRFEVSEAASGPKLERSADAVDCAVLEGAEHRSGY
jgi:hypothetical protein